MGKVSNMGKGFMLRLVPDTDQLEQLIAKYVYQVVNNQVASDQQIREFIVGAFLAGFASGQRVTADGIRASTSRDQVDHFLEYLSQENARLSGLVPAIATPGKIKQNKPG